MTLVKASQVAVGMPKRLGAWLPGANAVYMRSVRVVELSLSDFKGIDVRLRWQRLNVLFGPNDAGKTNILEAVAAAFGEYRTSRAPAENRTASPRASVLLELDEPDSDEVILAALLQWNHVPPLFPAPSIRSASRGNWAQTIAPAHLRWAGRKSGSRSFALHKNRMDVDDPAGTLLPLQQARDELAARGIRAMRGRADSPQDKADAELLLAEALQSPWLLVDRGVVSLLCPATRECPAEIVSAGKRLARGGWRSDDVLGPFISQLADEADERQPLLRMTDKRDFRPFDVVWAAGQEAGDGLETELRREFDRWFEENSQVAQALREILRNLSRVPDAIGAEQFMRDVLETTKVASNTSPSDRWLRQNPPDFVAPAKWVVELAENVSAIANELAAPVVRESGVLELAVLNARQWVAEDRRLEPRLQQLHRERATPLTELGLGLRTWSAIAVLEAASAQQHDYLPELHAIRHALKQMAPRAGRQSAGEGAPPTWLGFGSRKRLLIVDEPEQHLHLRAQHAIAAWLADEASERETLLASHALAFLALPNENATYSVVMRAPDGLTGATDITDDMFDSLERLSEEAGLSGRAEALQTVRLVALVEGAHDEMVLRHFYGTELARHRILVVPVRSASNVNAIFDAPWLSRLGLPLVVLFDEVRAEIVEGRKRPSGRDIASRAVWELLRNWREPKPRPHVASFDLPDIFRALPEECLRRAVQQAGGSFPGWDDIDAAFARDRQAGFKNVLRHRSHLRDANLNQLLSSTLEICRRKPHRALDDAVRFAIDHARISARPPADT